VYISLLFLRHCTFEPRPRLLEVARDRQASADLVQAATQAFMVDASVDVPFFSFRNGSNIQKVQQEISEMESKKTSGVDLESV
jgi:hypothetical protein